MFRVKWFEKLMPRIDFEEIVYSTRYSGMPYWFNAYIVAPIQAYFGGIATFLKASIIFAVLVIPLFFLVTFLALTGATTAAIIVAAFMAAGAAISSCCSSVIELLYAVNSDNFEEVDGSVNTKNNCAAKKDGNRNEGLILSLKDINSAIKPKGEK